MLINHFLENGHINSDQLLILQEEQKQSNKPLHHLAVDLNFISEETCLKTQATYFDLDYVPFKQSVWESFASFNKDLIPYNAFVYQVLDDALYVALKDPLDLSIKDQIRAILGFPKSIVWSFSDVQKQDYLFDQSLDVYIHEALNRGVSDLHFKATENTFDLYYRLHGVLMLKKSWHKNFELQIINQLKILSSLDITQSRLPQSGAYRLLVDNRSVDIRISTHPTQYGENMALRLLDIHKKRKSLEDLGFPEDHLNALKASLDYRHGLIVVSGATGSGKTTTLYACLDYLKDNALHITTLEDPIECSIPYAAQTEVSPLLSYADGIRSLLRQDPDVILVGEIRDEETARMAFRASMTGHLVLTTLHTQNLESITHRLHDLGISTVMCDEFLLCSLNQRLEPLPHEACGAKGCSECDYLGVLGRKLMVELKRNG